MAAILEADDVGDAEVREVIEMVMRHGGHTYTRQRAEAFVAEARGLLAELPPSPARDALHALAEYVITRDR